MIAASSNGLVLRQNNGSETALYIIFLLTPAVCACALSAVCCQVGAALSLADVAVLCAALPLFSSVLSAEARQPYPALAAWLASTSQNPHFNRVLGEQQQQHRRCRDAQWQDQTAVDAAGRFA
jgi:hypothetical protein